VRQWRRSIGHRESWLWEEVSGLGASLPSRIRPLIRVYSGLSISEIEPARLRKAESLDATMIATLVARKTGPSSNRNRIS
jgi:hypothetical protein